MKNFSKWLCAVVALLPSSHQAAEKALWTVESAEKALWTVESAEKTPWAVESKVPPALAPGLEMLPGRQSFSSTEGVEVVPLLAIDEGRKIVAAECEQIVADFGKSDPLNTVAKFYEPLEYRSAPIKAIFPGYRFFLVAWKEYDADPKRHMLGRAAMPGYVLAVAPDGTKTRLHEVRGDELLVAARVRIRSIEEADLAWRALCETRNRRAIGETSAKVSDTEWKLGCFVLDSPQGKALMRNTYHTQVITDADGFVTAAIRHRNVVIANADPKTREKVTMEAPTRLLMSGRPPEDFEVYADDLRKTKKVPLTVGANMATGVKMKLYVYEKGTPRPEKPFQEAVIRDLRFRTFDRFKVNRKRDGFAAPGKQYVVELVSEAFETDQPYGAPPWAYQSDKYRVIWTQSLQQITPALK